VKKHVGSTKKSAKARAPSGFKPGKSWQLHTAKACFSEVFQRARAEGPQTITRQGKEAVVIIPAEEFERLTARSTQPLTLSQFFAQSPLAKANLDLERVPDYGRKVEL
jgi:antitoxin Phd